MKFLHLGEMASGWLTELCIMCYHSTYLTYFPADSLEGLRPVQPFNILEPTPTYGDGRQRDNGKLEYWSCRIGVATL
jgi:hypothetical protein